MKFIKYYFDNNYADGQEEGIAIFDDDFSDESIDEIVSASAYDWADDQTNGVEGWSFDEGWASEEAEEEYFENCDNFWEEIDYKTFVHECKDGGTIDFYYIGFYDVKDYIANNPLNDEDEDDN